MPEGSAERPAVVGADGHPSDGELRGHLDDQLDPETDQRVAAHLERCEECVARLDTFTSPPVLDRTSSDAAAAWDERGMRRSIRRTLLRTAVNTVGLLLAGALALQFVGQLVLQPLFVDRGNRVQQSVLATHDVPVLTIPGAEVAQVVSNPNIIRRTTEVEVQRTVGAETVPLGWLSTRLGPLGMSTSHGALVSPAHVGLHRRDGSAAGDRSPVPFEPERLADGTAVTVELVWTDGLDQADAQDIADEADGTALLWVGFLVPGADPRHPPEARVGYSACGAPMSFLLDASDRGWGGFGGSGFRQFDLPVTGVPHALEQVRRATANLAETGWLVDDDASGPLANADATATALTETDPDVTTLVLTGPTDVIATTLEDTTPDYANLLEVDFDRGAPAPCG